MGVFSMGLNELIELTFDKRYFEGWDLGIENEIRKFNLNLNRREIYNLKQLRYAFMTIGKILEDDNYFKGVSSKLISQKLNNVIKQVRDFDLKFDRVISRDYIIPSALTPSYILSYLDCTINHLNDIYSEMQDLRFLDLLEVVVLDGELDFAMAR